jgi:hypothetical protein
VREPLSEWQAAPAEAGGSPQGRRKLYERARLGKMPVAIEAVRGIDDAVRDRARDQRFATASTVRKRHERSKPLTEHLERWLRAERRKRAVTNVHSPAAPRRGLPRSACAALPLAGSPQSIARASDHDLEADPFHTVDQKSAGKPDEQGSRDIAATKLKEDEVHLVGGKLTFHVDHRHPGAALASSGRTRRSA